MIAYANGTPAPVETCAVVRPVTTRELLALADVPNLRIEEYEEHRNDRPQRYVNTMQDYDRIGREDWDK